MFFSVCKGVSGVLARNPLSVLAQVVRFERAELPEITGIEGVNFRYAADEVRTILVKSVGLGSSRRALALTNREEYIVTIDNLLKQIQIQSSYLRVK